MAKIELTQGKFAIIDDKDYEYLNQWNWYYTSKGYAGRAKKINGKRSLIFIHRFLIDPPIGFFVDHINGNRLDNRRSNLRICTTQQNNRNSKKYKNSFSRYKGVSYEKSHKSWKVSIRLNGKLLNLGRFNKEHHAALCYDLWAKDLFGDFARTNF